MNRQVTRDCNCPVPAGHVKAERVAGGYAAGRWGEARVGDVLMIPAGVAEAHPEYWEVISTGPASPEPAATASQELDGLTVAELTALAAERGVQLPRKARKTEIVQVLTDAA